MATVVDYIIVGQGLAGSTLAIHLDQLGKSLMMIDEPEKNVSSRVAAGLYNPITGRKMVKTWRADDIFPYLKHFYSSWEKTTQRKFLHEMPIYRPFLSLAEQNEWMGKSADKKYMSFLDKVEPGPAYENLINDPYGGLELTQCGFLDISSFLEATAHYFHNKESLVHERFDFHQLRLEQNAIQYRNIQASKIIFCEGPDGDHKNYFHWLPFRPVKGEILYLEVDKKIPKIFNRGVFVIPYLGNKCKAGATYDRKDLTPTLTEKARRSMVEKLNALVRFDYKIVDQVSGIRPSTIDRRPFAGIHPKFETIAIFNGLGTKGVSLAPYFAAQLANHLNYGKELDREVNISRFFSLYFKFGR